MTSTKAEKPFVGIEEAQKILGSVPYERGFHFFSDTGKYTGESAINLFSFYEELRTIELQSVRFHFQRRDFQNWIRNTLGDAELADRIDKINIDLSNDELRTELREILIARLEELTSISRSARAPAVTNLRLRSGKKA